MEPKLEALLTEHERLLDEIVSDQEYVNNFTTRKQLNEEALKILKKEKQTEHCEHWVCVGDFFIKLPHHTITHILEKEQVKLGNELNSVSKSVQDKAQRLQYLENQLSHISLVSFQPKQ